MCHLCTQSVYRTALRPQFHAAIELQPCAHLQAHAYGDPHLVQMPEQCITMVLHSHDPHRLSYGYFGKPLQRTLLHPAMAIRNGIAMGVEGWPAKVFIELLHQLLAGNMLEFLGHLVHLVPSKAQPRYQEGLP